MDIKENNKRGKQDFYNVGGKSVRGDPTVVKGLSVTRTIVESSFARLIKKGASKLCLLACSVSSFLSPAFSLVPFEGKGSKAWLIVADGI